MSTRLAERMWPACLSALHLDRFLMGEMDGPEAALVREHLSGCVRCSGMAEKMRETASEALPLLRRVAPIDLVPARGRRWARAVAAGAGLAAAASLLLLLRPAAPGERAKGTGFALIMYVQHGGQVRRAGPGEVVAAGDAVRFAVKAPRESYVAVLSLDPKGHGSIYFPLGARAERVAAGGEVALPLGTRLDATMGEERIVGLFCASPVELESVRARLESGGPLVPDGCQVTQWSFVKR